MFIDFLSMKREHQKDLKRWKKLLEDTKGELFLDKAKALFKSKDLGKLDINKFEKLLMDGVDHIRFLAEVDDPSYKTDTKYQQKAFDDIFSKTCTELALEQSREELTEWVNKVEKGKALFVDAPMGSR